MESFAQYFLERQLDMPRPVLSESTNQEAFDGQALKKLVRLFRKEKEKHTAVFGEKYPKIQNKDIDEAFDEAIKKVLSEPPKSRRSAESLLKKTMHGILSRLKGKKRAIKKSLSCVGVIKSQKGDKTHISELMSRASHILTAQEKKVLHMCSQGKSVRSMGVELKMSFPTVWRSLNSGIDKIRMSHGMDSRHKGIKK